jgi:hypothetical protein
MEAPDSECAFKLLPQRLRRSEFTELSNNLYNNLNAAGEPEHEHEPWPDVSPDRASDRSS